jgi:hypothetical protein
MEDITSETWLEIKRTIWSINLSINLEIRLSDYDKGRIGFGVLVLQSTNGRSNHAIHVCCVLLFSRSYDCEDLWNRIDICSCIYTFTSFSCIYCLGRLLYFLSKDPANTRSYRWKSILDKHKKNIELRGFRSNAWVIDAGSSAHPSLSDLLNT